MDVYRDSNSTSVVLAYYLCRPGYDFNSDQSCELGFQLLPNCMSFPKTQGKQ